MNIEALGAVKWGLDKDVPTNCREKPSQIRAHGPTRIGRHCVVLMHRMPGGLAQFLKRIIQAAIPIARLHQLPFCHATPPPGKNAGTTCPGASAESIALQVRQTPPPRGLSEP
jgi:hypothetical protein